MLNYWINSKTIQNLIFIPKYYDPEIQNELDQLISTHEIYSISELIDDATIEVTTGHEIGKLAYGTGDIPFVRTSDISNWEIKSTPKQGVSQEIYDEYCTIQDVREGDVLVVRDGTYLIGTNSFVTKLDAKILFQSHILKFRINTDKLNPILFFLALNSPLVQRQIKNIQFTADIIDTIGNRYREIRLAIPKSESFKQECIEKASFDLEMRVKGKAFIKQCPTLIENALVTGSTQNIEHFLDQSIENVAATLKQDTVTGEFGEFEAFWYNSANIQDTIFLPKYYDPSIVEELKALEKNCDIHRISYLRDEGILEYHTGDEIGKMAYGTGNIPFVRTSDFSNWEIKHDPKQGISEEIYEQYQYKQDVKTNDILLVRDGTYLVGSSCIITESNAKSLFCGGLYKIRSLNPELLDPWLLLGLLNSYIVKRQLRTKQFTRDVIDTLGHRIGEIFIPIPKNIELKKKISLSIRTVIDSRIKARNEIKDLSAKIMTPAHITQIDNILSSIGNN